MQDDIAAMLKDRFVKTRFADAFVDILREVNRHQRGAPGASELKDFFDLLNKGAKVTLGDLADAALERIRPLRERYIGKDDERKQCEQALLDVALAGLAFLIENAATDEVAGTRRSIRENKLIEKIRRYNEAWEACLRKERGSSVPRSKKRR